MRIKAILFFLLCFTGYAKNYAQFITEVKGINTFSLSDAVICIDVNDAALVQKAAALLQQDIEMVTGKKLFISNKTPASSKTMIIIGTAENSALIKQLIQQKKISAGSIKNKWEGYQIQSIKNPFKGIDNALVLTGSDRRGTAFGVFELSKQIGVSPWYWWADVPVKKRPEIFVKANTFITC
ncbi:MAG: hypothetical protein H7Z13_19960 [Ferruginibacter sp.]|nr:hypothetical protein [Ferruginibacter sp.]